eukprot:CAMPEP_0168456892 /NCGR_PEP_ID=MMETSP0228-20121227/51541_1 /TAXON_ID=133427 /ORGANISM="Protoceratium reticulatum, Strain CCCM 535 (=CCMP 1889)" /LENGTH=145 /DNA_ID=CAMNT_0008471865 /DNA_START=282 /DNA_END=716 /DNA_ORIENTATION=-
MPEFHYKHLPPSRGDGCNTVVLVADKDRCIAATKVMLPQAAIVLWCLEVTSREVVPDLSKHHIQRPQTAAVKMRRVCEGPSLLHGVKLNCAWHWRPQAARAWGVCQQAPVISIHAHHRGCQPLMERRELTREPAARVQVVRGPGP